MIRKEIEQIETGIAQLTKSFDEGKLGADGLHRWRLICAARLLELGRPWTSLQLINLVPTTYLDSRAVDDAKEDRGLALAMRALAVYALQKGLVDQQEAVPVMMTCFDIPKV